MQTDSAPANSLGVGIDFGTSNSAAAIFDGETLTTIPLELDSYTIPSATYIDRKYTTSTGQQAINQYIESNVGRLIELSAELLGESRTTTGQLDETGNPSEAETRKIYGRLIDDKGMQGRLIRGVKRLLSDGEINHLTIFDRPFRLVALLTPLLLRIKNTVQEFVDIMGSSEDPAIDHACIGFPVNFEAVRTPDNALALSRLAEAYRHAGIARQGFCPEPIAATLSYLSNSPDVSADTVLTVDFGGGTLDFCVLQMGKSGYEVVAVHGIGLGGDHIDQRLYTSLIMPLIGKGEYLQRRTREGEDRKVPFPFSTYEPYLNNWVATYMLNQSKYITPVIEAIEQGGSTAVKFNRLLDLIRYNYNYQVFQSIRDFKAALSDKDSAILDIPELDMELSLSRTEFEQLIAEELASFETAVLDTLAQASIQPDGVGLVLRTGGSSLIPAVANILERHFPGKVIEYEPLTSVAGGLAIASYHGRDFESDREFVLPGL
jgi:hypothetical chaperone protein